MKQLILIFALAAVFAACNSTPPAVTPEQLPVNASEGIYGVPNTAEAVWPVWSAQVYWCSRSSADIVGPLVVQIQLPSRPGIQDIARYVPQPKTLTQLGLRYKPCGIENITQVGQAPIGQNPTK